MRIAIVCDWLVTYAGAERVLEQMLACYPEADLYSVVDFLPENSRGFIHGKAVTTSFIQKLPRARTKYRGYLPLMPLAIEQMDVSRYDVVISSSHAVAKGIITGPHQVHVCYCHSPIRYAWDLQHQYLAESGLDTPSIKGWLARLILHYMRLWDARTAHGVDAFIANSEFVARRIAKAYGRQATVIYPPVDTVAFPFRSHKDDFYLTASRMVPYKKVDLIVDAFSQMPNKQLIVIGDGPGLAEIKKIAGPNVRLLGQQPFEVLRDYMQRARAFVFAAEEDFGIAPVEAQSCGTPVIAYGRGGCLETIRGLDRPRPTGLFFAEQSTECLIEAVQLFELERGLISPADCRMNAEQYSTAHFVAQFTRFVDHAVAKVKGGAETPRLPTAPVLKMYLDAEISDPELETHGDPPTASRWTAPSSTEAG